MSGPGGSTPVRESAAGEHGLLAERTAISAVLRLLAEATGNASASKWIPRVGIGRSSSVASADPNPFLSVVTRTQGKRLHALRETLLCLAAQTCTDFELLIVAHKVAPELQPALGQVLEQLPDWLRARTRRLAVDEGGRTRPLNVGFAEARGAYVAILDDDDLVLANWVDAFRSLAREQPGRVLRAATVRQNVEHVAVLGQPGLRASGPPEPRYPSRFDLFDHLYENYSPPVSLAFPRSVFHDLGQHFDEALTTIEDWDYLMRAAFIVGVASTPTVTSVYRWWPTGPSSRTEHPADEWDENRERILRKMDTLPIVLPPGAAGELRAIIEERDILRAHIGSGLPWDPRARRGQHPRMIELHALTQSTSWRLTAPLRMFATLLGDRSLQPRDLAAIRTAEEAARLVQLVRGSWSWRLTAPLRRLAARRQR